MPGRNGTAGPPGRVYHAVPRTAVFAIEVIRGGEPRVVDFHGQYRDRCTVWAQIEVEAAWDRWRATVRVDNTDHVEVVDPLTGEVTVPATIYRESSLAEATLRRDMLVAVLHDPQADAPIQEHEADVIAADGGGWDEILSVLGWHNTRAAEGTANPEDGGEADVSPGRATSPDARPSTVPTTGGV